MNEMKQEPLAGAPQEVDAATAEVAATAAAPRAPKRMLRIGLMLIVPLLLVIGLGYYWLASGGSVSTDDSQIKQDIVSVSAQVNGPIIQVAVRNGQTVKQGELLFRIDPAPYRVALEQAQAQLAAAQLQNQLLRSQSAGTGGDIVGSQADLEIKRRALARQTALLKQGFTTRSDFDDAVSEVRKSETDLANARARAANASAAIAPGEQPNVAAAMAALDKARLDLSRTEIRAPMAGIVERSHRRSDVGLLAGRDRGAGVGRPCARIGEVGLRLADFGDGVVIVRAGGEALLEQRRLPGQRAPLDCEVGLRADDIAAGAGRL